MDENGEPIRQPDRPGVHSISTKNHKTEELVKRMNNHLSRAITADSNPDMSGRRGEKGEVSY